MFGVHGEESVAVVLVDNLDELSARRLEVKLVLEQDLLKEVLTVLSPLEGHLWSIAPEVSNEFTL